MKIIGMSLVHNDKSKDWLEEWLNTNLQYCDEYVILDDCSTDGTYDFIKNYQSSCKIYLTQTIEPVFIYNESKLRSILWEQVRKIATEEDWILSLDSDEILCPEFKDNLERIKDGTKSIIVFKKIEMWDKENYNIDGLWSNYFIRMFPFLNVKWEDKGPGFHKTEIPKEIFSAFPIHCSDVRIKHLAYQSKKLRREKLRFMLNSPQQKKDVNYKHLLSLNFFPKLKKYKEKYEFSKTLLCISCLNLYKLNDETKDFLTHLSYYTDKVEILFLIYSCNLNLIEQVKILTNTNIKYIILLLNKETYYNFILNKISLLRKFLFDNNKSYLDKYEYIIFSYGENVMNYPILYNNLLVEKDVVENIDKSIITLSSTAMQFLYSSSHQDMTNSGLLTTLFQNNFLIWKNGFSNSPELIQQSYKKLEEEAKIGIE